MVWHPKWVGILGGLATRVGWHPEWVETPDGSTPLVDGTPSGLAAWVG